MIEEPNIQPRGDIDESFAKCLAQLREQPGELLPDRAGVRYLNGMLNAIELVVLEWKDSFGEHAFDEFPSLLAASHSCDDVVDTDVLCFIREASDSVAEYMSFRGIFTSVDLRSFVWEALRIMQNLLAVTESDETY